MAVYMPADKRRRRTAFVVIGAVLIGLIAGFGLGRATGRGIDDALSDARDKGAAAVTALTRLPIEYEQKVGGTGGETAATLLDSVAAARTQLNEAFAAARWLTAAQKSAATSAIADVRAAIENEVSIGEFRDTVARASAVVARTFGVSRSSDLD
jgi:hypothetical protein